MNIENDESFNTQIRVGYILGKDIMREKVREEKKEFLSSLFLFIEKVMDIFDGIYSMKVDVFF